MVIKMNEGQDILISVVIPVYNAERFLRQTLDSVLNQTHRNLEVICVNDGSVDSSKAIVDEYASKDARVVALHCENKGVSVARNIGVSHASGDFITFIDCDDFAMPTMYERLLKLALANNADIAEIGYVRVDDDFKWTDIDEANLDKSLPGFRKQVVSNKPWKTFVKYHKKFSGGLFCPVWHRLYKAGLAKKCFFLEGIQPGEDTFFSIWAFYNARKYAASNEVGLLYRQNKDSVSHSKWRDIVSKNICGRAEIIRWFMARRKEFCKDAHKDVMRMVTRELVSWPLKTAMKSNSCEDRHWLRNRLSALIKDGVLKPQYLPFSKRVRLYMFLLSTRRMRKCK